jgi:hypothetical protein
MPQAKTIKQAKAAYKNRSEQPLTEREQKQLERSVQLDRRAWSIREREKSRLDLAKQRVAQEKAQKDEERRIGTQRRNDKFGFKSSQFHLGAFFRRPNPMLSAGSRESNVDIVNEHSKVLRPGDGDKATGSMAGEEMDAEEDEYEDVDDESLLEALQSPELARFNKAQLDIQAKPDFSMPPPPRPAFVQPITELPGKLPAQPETDLEWLDFLESSTQIARELGTEASTPRNTPPHVTAAKEPHRTGSFSSGSFELTEDDIEQLDPTPRACTATEHSAKQAGALDERIRMPPPPLPTKRSGQRRTDEDSAAAIKPIHPVKTMHAQDDLGFSMTQLESFVEDDLQLTQAE